MKNTPVTSSALSHRQPRLTFAPDSPTSTFVTSGSSVGSVPGASSSRLPKLGSLTAFLTIDPLRPTRDTPAMTVIRDIHLGNKSQPMPPHESLRRVCACSVEQTGWEARHTQLVEPEPPAEEDDGEDADEEHESPAGHLINRDRGVEQADIHQLYRCIVTEEANKTRTRAAQE